MEKNDNGASRKLRRYDDCAIWMSHKGLQRTQLDRDDPELAEVYERRGTQRIARAFCTVADPRPAWCNQPAAKGKKGLQIMATKTTVKDQLDLLTKLVDLGGEDPVLTQTIGKLLEYAKDKHHRDLEEISAKLQTLEEQFRMPSDVFYLKFHRGELGDDEEFFRWDALVEMRQRVQQRLSMLQTGASA